MPVQPGAAGDLAAGPRPDEPVRRPQGAVEAGQDRQGGGEAGAVRHGRAAAGGVDPAEAVPAADGGDDLPQLQLRAAVGVGALRGRVVAAAAARGSARHRGVGGRQAQAAVPADRGTEGGWRMTEATLDEQVAALEAELARLRAENARLKATVEQQGGDTRSGWEQIVGSFAGDEAFEEAMRLGREWRESFRPKPRKRYQVRWGPLRYTTIVKEKRSWLPSNLRPGLRPWKRKWRD